MLFANNFWSAKMTSSFLNLRKTSRKTKNPLFYPFSVSFLFYLFLGSGVLLFLFLFPPVNLYHQSKIRFFFFSPRTFFLYFYFLFGLFLSRMLYLVRFFVFIHS